jgi:hypothetical protein
MALRQSSKAGDLVLSFPAKTWEYEPSVNLTDGSTHHKLRPKAGQTPQETYDFLMALAAAVRLTIR